MRGELNAAEAQQWSLEIASHLLRLQDNLEDVTPTLHGMRVQGIDQVLSGRVSIHKQIAFDPVELIQAFCLYLPDDRVHRACHIGIDFPIRKAIVSREILVNGFE
jgi:hypothetical protein